MIKRLYRSMMVAILAAGCLTGAACVKLTEEQRNEVSAINAEVASLGVNLRRLEPIATEFYGKIKDILEKVTRGEIPKEEGERLVALYKEKQSAAETEIRVIVQKGKELVARERAIMESANVPWYQELWLLVPGLLAAAATTVVGVKKAKKYRTVIGALARAGDRVAGFGKAVHEEVNAGRSGITTKDTDKMHGLAKAREI